MSQTFASITTASDNVKVGIVNLDDRTDSLRSSFSGTSAPGTPVEGQLWYDTTNDILKAWTDLDGGGASWHEIATDYLQSNMDFNDNQALNFRTENEATSPTAGAGNVGKLVLYTGGSTNRLQVVRDASNTTTVMEGHSGEYQVVEVPVSAWDWGSTPPTVASVGTTPTVVGAEFNATAETMSVAVSVPAGMDAASDVKVRFFVLLSSAETVSDTIDATLNSISLLTDGTELATATSVSDAVSHDIGANNSQYSLHTFDFTLAYNDGTVPIVAGDMLITEFALSSVASVAGIIVLTTQFLFPFGDSILET